MPAPADFPTRPTLATPRPAAKRRNIGSWRLFLFVVSFLVMLVSIGGIYIDYDLGSSWMHVQATIISLLVISLVAAGRFGVGTFYLFSTAYVIAFCIFLTGYTFLHALGAYDFRYYVAGPERRMFEVGGWYTTLAVACFIFAVPAAWRRPRHLPASNERKTLSLADAYWAGIGLLVASVFLFGLTWMQVGNIFRFSRAEIFGGVGDTRGFGTFLMAFPSALVLLVIGARKRSQRLFAFATASLGILFLMFLGYRSQALFPMLVGAVVWVKIGRRIPITLLVTGIFAVTLVIPAVSYFRQLGSYDQLTTTDIAKSFEATKAADTFIEIGGSGGIVAYVAKWVPEEEPYRYGKSYLHALSRSIPNFGLQTREDDRAVFKASGYSVDTAVWISPADWYIFRVNRWMFDTGGGGGFSAVAEAYLNFGIVGIAVIFALYGFLFGRLDQLDLLSGSWRIIFICSLMWPFLTTVRNTFDNFLKPASLILVALLIWHYSTPWIAKLWRQRLVRNLAASKRSR